MPDIKLEDIKPDWFSRKVAIFSILILLGILISASLASAVGLALLSKFSITVSTYFIVFIVCNFITLLGVIGSYIFGSVWQTSDFLKILPDIIPHMHRPDEPPDGN